MSRAALILALLLACLPGPALAQGPCSVADFGARGDGVADDRAPIQAALDACPEVVLPPGRYRVTQGAGAYAIRVDAGRTLRGAGEGATTIVQAAGAAPNVRVLHVAGAGAIIADLTLDGDRKNQTPDEHRAGIFVTHAPRVTIRHVTARDFAGDGFYVHIGSDDILLDGVTAVDNDRNGISFGGGTRGAMILDSRIAENGVQQIDSEPGEAATVDGVVITGSTIDGGSSNDYALTMSGSGPTSRSRGWAVTGNAIRGAVLAVWLDASVIASNNIVNATSKSCVTVYRRSIGVAVTGNTCAQVARDGVPGMAAIGTTDDMPEAVAFVGNAIELDGAARAFGFQAQGMVSVVVARNDLRGLAIDAAGQAAIQVRATGSGIRSAVVASNAIIGWDATLHVAGNAGPVIERLQFTGNRIEPRRRAVVVDADAVPLSQERSGNACTGGGCEGANLP